MPRRYGKTLITPALFSRLPHSPLPGRRGRQARGPSEEPRAPGPQGAAAWLGSPALQRKPTGELPPKRRVGDEDGQRVLDGDLFQPRRRLVDSSGLGCGWVLPADPAEYVRQERDSWDS